MLFNEKAKGDIVRLTMSFQPRRELLAQVVTRYREASREQKSIILNEFIASSGYARKYAIRLLSMPIVVPVVSIQRQRKRNYGTEVQEALQILWGAANFIGSKRLAPFLEELVPAMERHGDLEVTVLLESQLPKVPVQQNPAFFSKSRFWFVHFRIGTKRSRGFLRPILWPIVDKAPKGLISTPLC
jgi:hypothetical protein